jgi:hypothetical protein
MRSVILSVWALSIAVPGWHSLAQDRTPSEESLSNVALEPSEGARLRARLLNLPAGTEIRLSFENAQSTTGELADAAQDDFALWTRMESGGKVKRRFRYDAVTSSSVPDWKGWKSPTALREVDTGRRVEVLLIDNRKVRGRLLEVSELDYRLELESGGTVDYSVDRTASVRTLGRSLTTKLIIVASVVGLIALAGYTCAFCGQ